MPKTKISEFSATPANNTDIDSINIAEGCAPSGINDAIRELMAQLKDFQTGAVGDSFNGPIGTSTAAAGAFTTLAASSTLGVTGVATFSAGTAALPALTTSGDTNTGIFFPAADTVATSTGGSERLRITSAGDVGIGTTTATAKLTVINTADANKQIVFGDSATYYGSVGHNSGSGLNEYRTEASGGHGFFIGTSGTANLTINSAGNTFSSGNIGIGGTTPTTSGTGITFPATQSASSNANTLDDYEEGTFTPNQGAGLTVIGSFSSSGIYTKIGNLVTVNFRVNGSTSIASSSGGLIITNLPFSIAATPGNAMGSCLNSNNVNAGAYGSALEIYAGTTALAASAAIFVTITYQV